MAACPRCRRKSAKRFCPALGQQICSTCCARERMLEIECPESCQYLASGRLQASEREQEMVEKETAAAGKVLPWLNDRARDCLAATRWTIVEIQRRAFSDLQDWEISAAIENAIRNLETESAGIIYEHREYSTRVQELSRKIRKTLDELHSDQPTEFRPKTRDILEALHCLHDNVELHTRRGDPRSFIRYTALFYPWREDQPNEIVITG